MGLRMNNKFKESESSPYATWAKKIGSSLIQGTSSMYLPLTPSVRQIIRWLNPRKGESILSVLCGFGGLMSRLDESNNVGIDVFAYPLALARRVTKGDLINACPDQLPFVDSIFDKAVFYYSLGHIPDHEIALREAHRVLKQRGKLVLAFPNRNYLLYKLGLKRDKKRLNEFDCGLKVNNFRVLERKSLLRFLINIPLLWRYLYECIILLEKIPLSKKTEEEVCPCPPMAGPS